MVGLKNPPKMVKVLHLKNYGRGAEEEETTLKNIITKTNSYVISYYNNEFPDNEVNTLNGEFQESRLICSENVREFEECLRYGDREGMVFLYIEELEVKELLYQLTDEVSGGVFKEELSKIRRLKEKFKGLLK